jgi:hypothetical protein
VVLEKAVVGVEFLGAGEAAPVLGGDGWPANSFGALTSAQFGFARTDDVAGHSHILAHSLGPATDALCYWLRSAQTPAHWSKKRPRLWVHGEVAPSFVELEGRCADPMTSLLSLKLTYVLEELRARIDVTGKFPVVLFMKYFLQQNSI